MKEYLKSKEEVLQEVGASEKGLTSQEAAEREARDGKNKLAEGKKTSFIVKFLSVHTEKEFSFVFSNVGFIFGTDKFFFEFF